MGTIRFERTSLVRLPSGVGRGEYSFRGWGDGNGAAVARVRAEIRVAEDWQARPVSFDKDWKPACVYSR